MSGRCWRCGSNGAADPLDKHHIFGGALRDKSERYGLTVELCHERCHLYGPEAAHNNAQTMRKIKQYGQRKAMEENNWTVEDFIREFGKNYLAENEETPKRVGRGYFKAEEAVAMPY